MAGVDRTNGGYDVNRRMLLNKDTIMTQYGCEVNQPNLYGFDSALVALLPPYKIMILC